MIKTKLSQIKTQIKKNAPQIASATLVIASATCAIILKQKLNEQSRRFPTDGSTRLAVNQCCFDELKSGKPVIWVVDGHKIDIAYDPDC